MANIAKSTLKNLRGSSLYEEYGDVISFAMHTTDDSYTSLRRYLIEYAYLYRQGEHGIRAVEGHQCTFCGCNPLSSKEKANRLRLKELILAEIASISIERAA